MEHPVDNAIVRLTANYDGHDVDVIEISGERLWLARQVGAALDYHKEGQSFVGKLSSEWSDELDEGTDYRLLVGEELAALKALRPDLVDKRTPSLLLLTESGLYTAVMLSRQPKARAFRRWLATEVLPQLARTGSYAPAEPPPAHRPSSAIDTTLDRVRFLTDLQARGVISSANLAAEISTLLGAPRAPVFVHGSIDAIIPWLPTPPPWRVTLDDWEQLRVELTEWAAWHISLDLTARRLRGQRNLNAEFVGTNYPGWTKEKALGSGIHWPAADVATFLFRPDDWPSLLTWIEQPYGEVVMRLDAGWRRERQVIGTWRELLEAWGLESDASGLEEAQSIAAPLLRSGGGR